MLIILRQSVLGSLALILYHIFYGLLCLPSSPRCGATALDGEYVSTDFLATSKGWFFRGFSYLAWHTFFAFRAYYAYVYPSVRL